VEEAVTRTNIFDLPSFQMRASVQVDNQGKPLDGSYQLLWNGPKQWKEEVSFPGYTEVQVGAKGTIWTQRSTDFVPLRIYEMHAALGFGSGVAGSGSGHSGSFVQLGLTSKDTIKKIRSRKDHGDKVTCVEIEDEQKHSSEICVNDGTGTLVRGSSYEDRDFQPIGGKVFPRFLSFVENGQTVAKVNVTDLTASGQFPPDSFTPPAGSSLQTGCMNPMPFRLVKKVNPEYPLGARQQHIQGLVAVSAWISTNGVPRVGKVLASPSPSLENSAVNAVTQWRYEPARCSGQPVQVETVLRVNYALSH
jgi:TonB family protein